MEEYSYSISTNVIWASFDYGYVMANSEAEAREKAIAQLKKDFELANKALSENEHTKDWTIEFSDSEVEVTKK